jgi:nitronate monooxygenase
VYNLPHFPKLNIGDLELSLPIIQGGMGVGVSLSSLASAVAEEGGVGVISAAIINGVESVGSSTKSLQARLEFLRQEIRRSRRLTDGAIGVNILVALTDYEDYFRVSLEEGVECIFLGAGLPLKLPEMLADRGAFAHTKLIPIVSSARAARLIIKTWAKKYLRVPDAFVVEGPMAGGHLGFKPEQIDDPAFDLEHLLADVLRVAKEELVDSGARIPIIAAGGIYSGGDIDRFMQLGADGVQMATRFVTTYECDANLRFKLAYLAARREDIVIIKSPLGLPGRAVDNEFLRSAERGERAPRNCPWKCMKSCDQRSAQYCIAEALENARLGKLDEGFTFAGSNAYRADTIISVAELVQTISNEYRMAVFRRLLVAYWERLKAGRCIIDPQGGLT